jgi:hypothetical protein
MRTGAPFRAPDVQQLLRRARGTLVFRKQQPEGPCTPGRTKVHARHWFSNWQAKLHSLAPGDAVFLKSLPGRSVFLSKVKNLDWAAA